MKNILHILHPKLTRLLLVSLVLLPLKATLHAQQIPMPTISYAYVEWSSYWYKRTDFPVGLPSYYVTWYSRAFKTSYGAAPDMYTRIDTNGSVTIMTTTYVATSHNFRSTIHGGSTQAPYVEHRRDTAEFAVDYQVPGSFPGTIDVFLEADLNQVDMQENVIGSATEKVDQKGIPPGTVGRLFLRPQSMTKTLSYSGDGMYYLFPNVP